MIFGLSLRMRFFKGFILYIGTIFLPFYFHKKLYFKIYCHIEIILWICYGEIFNYSFQTEEPRELPRRDEISELTKLKFKIDMVLKTLFLMDKRLTLVEEHLKKHLKKRASKTES